MQRKYILSGGVVGLIILFGAFFFLKRDEGRKEKEVNLTPTPTVSLLSIEEEVDVSLTKKKDIEEVVLTISNIPTDIATIEYELTYLTERDLPRGVLGKITVSSRKEISRDITLGTCSRNVCVYDKNVQKISLALKFVGDKGIRGYQREFEI